MATHFRTFATLVLVAFVGMGVASLMGYDVGFSEAPSHSFLPTATETPATPTPTPNARERERWGAVRPADVRAAFHERLDAYRQNRSRMPLSANGRLRAVADEHSADMAAEGYVATDDPNGKTARERMRDAGVNCRNGRELVAAVRPDDGPDRSASALARTLFARWTDARSEIELMSSIGATRSGLGLYATDDGTVYATLDVC
ncbi:MAG: CAP domain-containing protein [Haloferacaceae archaeon]